MTPVIPNAGPAASPISGESGPAPDRLRQATRKFEAVFIQEMLKAMRDTVPEGGLLDAGRSEEVFTSLLDQHIAEVAATRSSGSLADALYRQFVGHVTP